MIGRRHLQRRAILSHMREEIRRLLDRIEFIRHPCDLDLLLFFVRHPRALLASEQIAAFVGYGLSDIAASLDVLLAAGLLRRTQHPAHAARMYRFAAGGTTDDWLPALLRLASTRAGRLALMQALAPSAREGTGGSCRADGEPPHGPQRTIQMG